MATIDNTIAGPSANSYCSLAEAQAYWETSPEGADLLAELPAIQEKWLIAATAYLEARVKWPSFRTTATQRLNLPRAELVYDDISIAAMAIPAPAKYAQAEMASVLFERDSDPEETKAPGISSLSIDGEISISFQVPDPLKAPSDIPSAVTAWLRQLGARISGGNSFAVVR